MGQFRRPELRELTVAEMELLIWLLEAPQPSLALLREQLPRVMVVSTCTGGCPTIDIGLRPELVRREGPSGRRINAAGPSPEREPVNVILH